MVVCPAIDFARPPLSIESLTPTSTYAEVANAYAATVKELEMEVDERDAAFAACKQGIASE